MRSRGSLFLLLWLWLGVIAAHGAEPVWTDYFGNQTTPADWAGLVRGVGLRHTGMSLAETGDDSLRLIPSRLDDLAAKVQQVIADKTVIMPVGGLASGRRQSHVDDFLRRIERDRGEAWKQLVYQEAVKMARLSGGRERVYWQIGNEINSRHYSLSLHTWAGDDQAWQGDGQAAQPRFKNPRREQMMREGRSAEGLPDGVGKGRPGGRERRLGGTPNDDFIIPYYAEYFLAPTVEALDRASREVFGQPGRIHIVLGSLAGAGSPGAGPWLDKLLAYRLKGTYAPGLKGRTVSELVEIIAVHYLLSYPGDNWRRVLDIIQDKWVGQGRIKGIWSTEEIGRRRGIAGFGASTAARVMARFVDWTAQHGLAPEYGKVNFWGADLGSAGSQGEFAMQLIVDHLPATPLSNWSRSRIELAPDAYEAYGFSTADNRRHMVTFFPIRNDQPVSFKTLKLRFDAGKISQAELHLFQQGAHRVVALSVENKDDIVQLNTDQALELSSAMTAVVFLQ